MRDDFYSVAFVYWLKRKNILGDNDDSDDENDNNASSRVTPDRNESGGDGTQSNIWKSLFVSNRREITGKLCFLVLCQMLLLYLVANETRTVEEMIEAYRTYPDSINIVLCRFLCAIFLHIHLSDELNQSFTFMKYAMNHYWKFSKWQVAFLVGFAQMMVIFSVEAVNLAILLTNNTSLDVIMNFLALVIICEFDDYLFNQLRYEPL